MRRVIEKYLELINTEHFAKYCRDFACRMQKGLSTGYKQRAYEPKLVSVVEKVVNELKELSTSTNRFKISTKSIFIHGPRKGEETRVEFEYYGQKRQTELGDLIFILSIIYNRRKYFEKFTISQFKKDDDRLRWDLSNKEQVYLLSRFPPFKGVRGSIIPQREFHLPNYSGCLGSYNLLYRPGDFVFVSASSLENFVRNRKSIDIINISQLWGSPSCCFTYSIFFDRPHIEKLFYICEKYCRYRFPIPFLPLCLIGILGFSHYASNVYNFVDKYLRGCIGDLIFSDIGVYNKPAFNFLRELLSAIMRKAQKEKKMEVVNFVNEFFSHPYGGNQGGMREGIEFDDEKGGMKEHVEFDDEEGGFGIIYTLIDLGGED
ncbi:MAG: hypothetical protein NC926_07620 [Candidatus Omnitrophica bacterium]|nr:hypothetical protein [Candidatus Omnitrophota bacterium]